MLLEEGSCMMGTGAVWECASPGSASCRRLLAESVECSDPQLLRPDVYLMPEEESVVSCGKGKVSELCG